MAKETATDKQKLFQIKLPEDVWERYKELVALSRVRDINNTKADVNLILLGINPPSSDVITEDEVAYFRGEIAQVVEESNQVGVAPTADDFSAAKDLDAAA